MTAPCSWANCDEPAVRAAGGDSLGPWWHCAGHLPLHEAFVAEEMGRPCATCGVPFQSPTVQRQTCDDCRESRRRRLPGHGTRSGYQKHLREGGPSCDPCAAAQSAYDRDRYQNRKSA